MHSPLSPNLGSHPAPGHPPYGPSPHCLGFRIPFWAIQHRQLLTWLGHSHPMLSLYPKWTFPSPYLRSAMPCRGAHMCRDPLSLWMLFSSCLDLMTHTRPHICVKSYLLYQWSVLRVFKTDLFRKGKLEEKRQKVSLCEKKHDGDACYPFNP